MKVVVLSGISRRAGGLYYSVSSLYKVLADFDVEVSVFGRADSFVNKDLSLWCPLAVSPYTSFGPLGNSVSLRRLLKNANADLVHQHGLWKDDQWAALQWQKQVSRPVVISPHGMLDPWALRNSEWKKKIVGRLFANKSLRKATCIHALCQSEAESIRAYGLSNPIVIIPNGVALPNESMPLAIKKKKGKRLLFLGRIHPKKGLNELIEAWSGFAANGTKKDFGWELLIAGWADGDYESRLKKKVADSGLADSVRFLGSKYGDDKDRLFRSVDAFVLPSFSEGLPMAVLEAWSYSLPVVMTDYCNIPEGFSSEAALRIYPDVQSVACGLDQLFAMSESDRQNMGLKGRKLVEQKFSWEQSAKKLAATYEWCLGGVRPACMYAN